MTIYAQLEHIIEEGIFDVAPMEVLCNQGEQRFKGTQKKFHWCNVKLSLQHITHNKLYLY